MKIRCKNCDARLEIRDEFKVQGRSCPRCQEPLQFKPGAEAPMLIEQSDASFGGKDPERSHQADTDLEEDELPAFPVLRRKTKGEKTERSLTDARPLIPRSADGLFYRLDQARDRIYDLATAELKRRGIQANILRSYPLSHPSWVSIVFWMPAADDGFLTSRSTVVFNIVGMPYHKYEIIYNIETDACGKKKSITGITSVDSSTVTEIVSYLLRETSSLSLHSPRVRKFPWELWRPKNKPDALRRDWLMLIPGALTTVGLITMPIGLIFLVIAIPVSFFLWRRDKVVRTSGKPPAEPRDLLLMDSWQTVIFGGGSSRNLTRERFEQRLQKPFSTQFRWNPEIIWYWGLDGVIEREQIVLYLARAVVFVHMHTYGDDLYVAWDAHLNQGQWVEQDLSYGIDKQSGRLALIKVVVRGTQRLTEYDITDANGLIEWTHAQIVQIVKQLKEELKIDQEIDFTIQRGTRQSLTGNNASTIATGVQNAVSRVRSVLHRVS